MNQKLSNPHLDTSGSLPDIWSDINLRLIRFDLTYQNPITVKYFSFLAKYPPLIQPDMHYELEMGIVLSGQVRRFYGGWQQVLEPGQVWFSGVWEPHNWKVQKYPFDSICVFVLPQYLSGVYLEPGMTLNLMAPFSVEPNQRPQIPDAQRGAMLDLGTKILRIYRQNTKYTPIWLRLLVWEALMMVMENWEGASPLKNTALNPYAKINRAIELVFEHRRLFSEADAARSCEMKLNTFNKTFKRIMGISFARFSLRHRIHGAASELISMDKPVKSIAFEWGFTDSSHFRRCFREHYGCGPNEYREQMMTK
jgi:AraC-like DNA-binding protein